MFGEGANGETGPDYEQTNYTDLEDWNAFIRNVDDALFALGVGR